MTVELADRSTRSRWASRRRSWWRPRCGCWSSAARVFLGRAVVADALGRGHDVTVFNRGTHPTPPARRSCAATGRRATWRALATGEWDSVDRHVRLRAAPRRRLGDAARAAHRPLLLRLVRVGLRAGPGAATRRRPSRRSTIRPSRTSASGHYGALKALCETAADDATGGRSLAVRPGLIVGPARSDRPVHVLAAPVRPRRRRAGVRPAGAPDAVRRRARPRGVDGERLRGAHHRPGERHRLRGRWAQLVDACLAEAPAGTRPVWVPEERLVAHDVGEWMELPLWIAPSSPEAASLASVDYSRATATGLTHAAARRHRPRHAGRGRAGRRRRSRAGSRARSAGRATSAGAPLGGRQGEPALDLRVARARRRPRRP